MAANNSCGSRSIRYGLMRDNVAAIDALLADGTKAVFGEVRRDAGTGLYENNAVAALLQDLLDLGGREAAEIRARFPRSEEHTSELQSLMRISYAVFCLK